MGIPGPEGHPNATRGVEREADPVHPIGDGEKQKAMSAQRDEAMKAVSAQRDEWR